MPQAVLTILHLDDDVLYLEQFAAQLARAKVGVGMRVVSVATVEELLEQVVQLKPDVVVLDIKVGGALRGEEAARRTKALHQDAVIFMCSDMKGIGLISACLAAGADDFVFKGEGERELALRLYGTWKLRSEGRQRLSAQAALQGVDSPVVGRTMQAVATRMERLAQSAVTAVHVRGESGTGKELVATLLRSAIPRGTPFVHVNCGAIAPTLLESELFGHVRGAFTGAQTDKAGLIEQAHGGWIFLDEVATLSPAAQVALLRALEQREVRRVGATTERKVSVRVLSATNEPVEELITQGRFRADLWQRLCEATVELPPLQQRRDEVPELVRHFCLSMDNGPYEIAQGAVEILCSYDWQEGNVRELRNCLRAMTELAVGKLLTPLSLPKWFWDKAGKDGKDDAAAKDKRGAAPMADEAEIRLAWSHANPRPFEQLASELLLEILRREAALSGKISVRQLARVTSIPKSTLPGKLRQLVDQDLIASAALARLVNIASD